MRIVSLLVGAWCVVALCAANAWSAPAPAQSQSQSHGSACEHLRSQFGPLGRGPLLLASFPTAGDGPLKNSAFLYDNAVAITALVGCGDTALARRIGDALLVALDRDRFWHDGRLRNAYAAGAVKKDETIKLPGWWDDSQQRWLEDRYQVGSDNGNMAWAMLALLALDKGGGDPAYRAGAVRIGQWVVAQQDRRGTPGFTGGTFAHEPDPEQVRWKSTEHNTDIAAAFARLAKLDPERWRAPADVAARFVESMWDAKRNCFATGTGDDGVTINPIIVLDAQAWPPLALPGVAPHTSAALKCAHDWLGFEGGYAYSEVRDGVWTEGSAQMLLLLKLLKRDDEARQVRAAIDRQRTPEGSYYAAGTQRLPTGFMLATDPLQPRLYFRLPHLGAVAWVALAEKGFNPFTGEFALPGGGG
jgi:hypothetical protein